MEYIIDNNKILTNVKVPNVGETILYFTHDTDTIQSGVVQSTKALAWLQYEKNKESIAVGLIDGNYYGRLFEEGTGHWTPFCEWNDFEYIYFYEPREFMLEVKNNLTGEIDYVDNLCMIATPEFAL